MDSTTIADSHPPLIDGGPGTIIIALLMFTGVVGAIVGLAQAMKQERSARATFGHVLSGVFSAFVGAGVAMRFLGYDINANIVRFVFEFGATVTITAVIGESSLQLLAVRLLEKYFKITGIMADGGEMVPKKRIEEEHRRFNRFKYAVNRLHLFSSETGVQTVLFQADIDSLTGVFFAESCACERKLSESIKKLKLSTLRPQDSKEILEFPVWTFFDCVPEGTLNIVQAAFPEEDKHLISLYKENGVKCLCRCAVNKNGSAEDFIFVLEAHFREPSVNIQGMNAKIQVESLRLAVDMYKA